MSKSKTLFFRCLLLMMAFILVACKSENTNTCEQDKLDGNWQAVVDSASCSANQKGEAYLALGGWDYFKFASNPSSPVSKILGITSTAVAAKKLDYFALASDQVISTYQTGNNAAKTIFFFASFLELYTYNSMIMDNGSGGNTMSDGVIASGEIDGFTGAGLNSNSGGSDGTTIDTATNMIQFKTGGNYYVSVYDSTADSYTYYQDTNGDGSGDATTDDTSILDTSTWTEVNQVAHFDRVEDPFSGSGFSVTNVTNFINKLIGTASTIGYLKKLENSLLALGLDSSSDSIKEINKFQSSVDNGATCSTLVNNPGLRIIELIVKNTSKDALSDYSSTNVFTTSELEALGETDTSTDSISGYTGTIGIKMLFKQAKDVYLPYWGDATDDTTYPDACCAAMPKISEIGAGSAEKNDGKITTSEIMCLSDTL